MGPVGIPGQGGVIDGWDWGDAGRWQQDPATGQWTDRGGAPTWVGQGGSSNVGGDYSPPSIPPYSPPPGWSGGYVPGGGGGFDPSAGGRPEMGRGGNGGSNGGFTNPYTNQPDPNYDPTLDPNQPINGGGAPRGGGGGGGGRGGGLPGGGVPGRGNYNPYANPGLTGLGNQYASQYRDALARNQQLYNSVLAGYRGTGQRQVQAQNQIAQGYKQAATNTLGMLDPMKTALGQQQQWQQGIRQGYGDLTNGVLGDIQNADASERQRIQNAYAQSMGATDQSMMNRGLGNTTVRDSVQRGVGESRDLANLDLTNRMAQMTAGYRSQLGQAGLGYENQANMQNTAQQNAIANAYAGYNTQWGLPAMSYLNQANQQNTGLDLSQYGFQAGTQIPYPNAGQYAQLAGQMGQVSSYGRGVY